MPDAATPSRRLADLRPLTERGDMPATRAALREALDTLDAVAAERDAANARASAFLNENVRLAADLAEAERHAEAAEHALGALMLLTRGKRRAMEAMQADAVAVCAREVRFALDGSPTAAAALDRLLAKVDALAAEVALARAGARPDA